MARTIKRYLSTDGEKAETPVLGINEEDIGAYAAANSIDRSPPLLHDRQTRPD